MNWGMAFFFGIAIAAMMVGAFAFHWGIGCVVLGWLAIQLISAINSHK